MSVYRIFSWMIAPVVALLLISSPAQAVGITYNPGGDAITKVAELPDTDEFKDGDSYVDLGWLHKEWSIFGAPFWVFDEKGYVFYSTNSNGTSYREASPAMVAAAGAAMKTTFPATWSMPFWKRWMGALIVGALILVLVLRRVF